MSYDRTHVAIERVDQRGVVTSIGDVDIDTNIMATWLPREELSRARIAEDRREQFQRQDGTLIERGVGGAILHVANRRTVDMVVFAEPGDRVVLGDRAMRGLNLRIDPDSGQLVDGGSIPAASMSA